MKEFMLIFRHEDGNKIASPEQIQVWMKQTMDWIGGYIIVKAENIEEAVEFAKAIIQYCVMTFAWRPCD